MAKDLLLVIDMQNVYAKGGVWECPGSEAAADKIKKLISAKEKSLDVIFTEFLPPAEPVGAWNDYNRENAQVNNDPYANEMMGAFSEELERYPLYSKSAYSSLAIPEVREAALKADRVLLSGVVAECCVLFTAFSLIDMGIKPVYLSDGVAGISNESEKAAIEVLSGLAPTQVIIGTVDEYCKQEMTG